MSIQLHVYLLSFWLVCYFVQCPWTVLVLLLVHYCWIYFIRTSYYYYYQYLCSSVTETKLWSASRPKFDPTSQYLAWLLRLLDVLTEAAVAKEKKFKQVQEFKGILSKVIEVRIQIKTFTNCYQMHWTLSVITQNNCHHQKSYSIKHCEKWLPLK